VYTPPLSNIPNRMRVKACVRKSDDTTRGVTLILDTILAELKRERDRLHRAISALEGTAPRRGRPKKTEVALVRPRRRMSAAARRRISEAKRKWWAEHKRKSA
jgi:hypothetical protein